MLIYPLTSLLVVSLYIKPFTWFAATSTFALGPDGIEKGEEVRPTPVAVVIFVEMFSH